MTAGGLLGRYELIAPIGRGGMAEVHLAVQRGHAGFEKLVVVKVIHDHLASQPAFVEMLLDEARLAALLKHPNVVDIYDLGEANGRHYVAMEYLEGEPLLNVLRAGIEGDRLDPLSTARVIADTAEGLDAAHRLKSRDGQPLGLVHHDVSLGNIVVLYSGQVKLVDFGVAKATQTKHSNIHGKLAYMAPEKLQHGGGDRRCDIWSLGVVAYEALTLSRLFKGGDNEDTVRQVAAMTIAPPSTINGEVPRDFDRVIGKALERDPDKRYQTAKELADDLEAVLSEHKYGGKNDRIAAYMQRTFAKTIAAREQVVREVLGERKPSEAAVEAAFPETADKWLNTPVTPHEPSDGRGVDDVLDDDVADELAGGDIDDRTEVGGPLVASVRIPEWAPYAAGAVVLLVIMVLATRGDPIATPAAANASRLVEPPPQAMLATPDAAMEVAVVAVDDPDGASDDEIDMSGDTATAATKPASKSTPSNKPAHAAATTKGVLSTVHSAHGGTTKAVSTAQPKPQPPKPKLVGDAPELYAQAMQMLRAGNAKDALAALEQARAKDPSYARIYYGLGMAYEDLGKRPQAKAAYQRYLALSPRAANADHVRDRIDRL